MSTIGINKDASRLGGDHTARHLTERHALDEAIHSGLLVYSVSLKPFIVAFTQIPNWHRVAATLERFHFIFNKIYHCHTCPLVKYVT